MIINKEFVLKGALNEPFKADITYSTDAKQKGIVLFCHGFKGFKDWGSWSTVAKYFAGNGLAFLKFNFSHSGMGLDDSDSFTALEKFATNTLNKEVEDIKNVENFIHNELATDFPEINTKNITIIGHSKGGVSALLYCMQEDTQIKKVCTWASPFDFHRSWNSKFIKKWKAEGVQYIKNARTNQMMPLAIEVLNDFESNSQKYSLQEGGKKLKIPYLILQGTNDSAVPMDEYNALKKNFPKASTHLIEGANHVFGAAHPYISEELPEHSKELVSATKDFILG